MKRARETRAKSRPHAQAFTMIELLAASGIAFLLAAVVFSIYFGALRILDKQGRWRADSYPAVSALDALALDLSCAVAPWGITNPPFTLSFSNAENSGFALDFYSAEGGGADQPRFYGIRETHFVLPGSNAAATEGVTRRWRTFRHGAQSGIESNERTWKGVRAVNIEVFDGRQWTNQWGNNATAAIPVAARVSLTCSRVNGILREARAEILMPSGYRIPEPKERR